MQTTIVEALMAKGCDSEFIADKMVSDARKLIEQGADPEAILQDVFGLGKEFLPELTCVPKDEAKYNRSKQTT